MPLRVESLVEQCALDQKGNDPVSREAFMRTWRAFVEVVSSVVRRGKVRALPAAQAG